MSRSYRKLLAVVLLLWLPVFTGSALATSVSMQWQPHHDACHSDAAQKTQHAHHAGMDMDADMDDMAGDMPPASCSACGTCHLACTGYLSVSEVTLALGLPSPLLYPPYQVSYVSAQVALLARPPLASA